MMIPSSDEKDDTKPRFAQEFQKYPIDNLYHLGLDTSNDLSHMFKGVEVVCMMGSPSRAQAFAEKVTELFPESSKVPDNLAKTDRCALFKVGKVVSISHGMGNPSCLIFLHEVSKLMYHAKVDFSKLKFLRLGTSGGVGVPHGTVCLTEEACDGELQSGYEHIALGVKKRWPTKGDVALNDDIVQAFAEAQESYNFEVRRGVTMSTDDYYEGQGRLDGALETWYNEEDKMKFLEKAQAQGVVNIEMESTCFLFFFNRLGARATIIGAALLDRLQGDQHSVSYESIKEFSLRPQLVVMEYLKRLFSDTSQASKH